MEEDEKGLFIEMGPYVSSHNGPDSNMGFSVDSKPKNLLIPSPPMKKQNREKTQMQNLMVLRVENLGCL